MENKTILIVEDNQDDLELALLGLNEIEEEVDVEVAQDGNSAIRVITDSSKPKENKGKLPALVLLDIDLPDMSGLEVLKRIRTDPITQRIPVVIFSSSDEELDICKGYELGANSYLQKPLNYDNLIKVLELLGMYWLKANIPSPAQRT